MNFEELLPIGSVVLLKNAQKKIVIMGLLQTKHTENGRNITYDYMGVPYPEGYMGRETGLLFNHENVQEVVFTGFVNEERETFIKVIQQILDHTEKIVSEANAAPVKEEPVEARILYSEKHEGSI